MYLKRWPTNKSQPWIYQEEIGKSIPRSFLVSKALGPVRQNHEKIRGAKAEPDDSHDAMMDKLETAPILSEENDKVNHNQPTMNQPEKKCPAHLRAYSKAHCQKQQNVVSGNNNVDGFQGSKISSCKDLKTVAQ